jgi:hypothetical protein
VVDLGSLKFTPREVEGVSAIDAFLPSGVMGDEGAQARNVRQVGAKVNWLA